MRFSVRWLDVCPGEEKRILRKSAFCADALTKKCTLTHHPHGKAHSPTGISRKSAFCMRDVTKKYILDGDAITATRRRGALCAIRLPRPETHNRQRRPKLGRRPTKLGRRPRWCRRPTQPPSRPAAPRRPVPYALAQHAQQPVDVRGGPHLLDDRLVLERLGDVCEYL